MKVSKNPKKYELFTDRDKDISDGNFSIVTENVKRPMARLWYKGFMKRSYVASLENMGWLLFHIRTMDDASFKQITSGLQEWIKSNPLKTPTQNTPKSNIVIEEIDGVKCRVDLNTGKYSPLVKETQKAVK
jgi:hypothetical protein